MKTKTDDELLPCPFCNSVMFEPELEFDEDDNSWFAGCMAHMEGGCGIIADGFTTKEAAIAAWNTRAPVNKTQ